MAASTSVLVFGGDGQVGRALRRRAGGRGIIALSRREADLTSADDIDAALAEHAPNVVVNCAVFQPVDRCEAEIRKAFDVNAFGPGDLAAACAALDVRVVHLSTDYVFDGTRGAPYDERDCPNPLSVYGRSKLAGEVLVRNAAPTNLVVRTSAVYGPPGAGGQPSFPERMLARARAGEPTRVVDDQIVSPTYVDDLADAVWSLAMSALDGVVHVAGRTSASWYDVAERVFDAAGAAALLERTSAAEFGAAAPRPACSALASTRLASLGLEPPAGLDDGLRRFLAVAEKRERPEAG